MFVGGVLAALMLLASAAFVGPQLLGLAGGAGISWVSKGPNGQVIEKQVELISAPELPATPPDLRGIFVRREDNALFVFTNQMSYSIGSEEGGSDEMETSFYGPELEVVVTRDTHIYRDDTFRAYSGEPPEGEIQQVLVPSSVDEIVRPSSIFGWGEKRGDRLIADILVYAVNVPFKPD